jgi:hypothetical protein
MGFFFRENSFRHARNYYWNPRHHLWDLFFEETEKNQLPMKTSGKFLKTIFITLALTALVSSQLLACPACGSANSNMPASPLTNGMNLGILTLFVVIASVLGSIATFFVFIIRKEAALAAKAAAEQNFSEAQA